MLPDTPPKIVENDPKVIAADCVALYEQLTQKTLQPAQAERLLINVFAYRESIVLAEIERVSWQNLIRFASGQMLDELGLWTGSLRLSGQSERQETDSAYRERLLLAPAAFSTAGSEDSYIYHARSADISIIDVAIHSPADASIEIFPLCEQGVPEQDVLDKVNRICSARKVRPLTDKVTVIAPVFVDFVIEAVITPYTDVVTDQLQAQQSTAIAPLKQSKSLLGITLADIIAKLKIGGVYDVHLVQPTHNQALAAGEIPRCTELVLSYAGAVNG